MQGKGPKFEEARWLAEEKKKAEERAALAEVEAAEVERKRKEAAVGLCHVSKKTFYHLFFFMFGCFPCRFLNSLFRFEVSNSTSPLTSVLYQKIGYSVETRSSKKARTDGCSQGKAQGSAGSAST